MINVRLQIWRDAQEYWTSAIRDPKALTTLVPHLLRCGVKHAVWDDFGHANIADGCLAIAARNGTLIAYAWGPNYRYCCDLAPLPRAAGKLSWDGIEPRELSGPLAEEVAQHTPCDCCDADITIRPFDVHGAPERPTGSVVAVQPLLRRPTLLERIIQLIVGCGQGEAVRGQ